MFISLSTWIYDYLPLAEMIQRVKKSGYENIEVSGSAWTDKWKWVDLVQIAEKNDINIISVHCLHHEIPQEKLDERTFMKYHENFYKNISGIPGTIVVEHMMVGSFKKIGKQALTRLNILKELALKYKLILSVENCPSTAFGYPAEAKYFLKNSIAFTFDAAHAAYFGIDPMEFEPFFPRVVNVHSLDVDERICLGLGDWLPPGLGKINWKRIIDSLKKINYQGPITVELNERNLKKAFSLCKKATSSSVFDLSEKVDDLFAAYSKDYLEKLI